jgi:hypothetical protein
MASNEQSVTLLRKNKRAQVEALNSLGFDLAEGTRASAFPNYVKWGAGLLDVTVAANRKSDGKKFFFTVEEWRDQLTDSEKELFLLRGVRVRACATSFIIAPDTIQNKAWGSSYNTPDLHNYSVNKDLYTYFNAYEETRLIAEYFNGVNNGGVIGAPAAEAALAYKAFTEETDGLADDSQWCLPTPAHLMIMFRWKTEIDAALTAIWSTDFNIAMLKHWSCGKWSNGEIYRMNVQSGGSMYVEGPTTTGAVRPICLT